MPDDTMPPMLQTERRRFAFLMSLHLLWGLVLYFSISKYGLGVSTDAVHLLFGALNMAGGKGLVSYDGRFVAFWPPLYPSLLAIVRSATGSDIMTAAIILQALSYVGMGIVLALLFERMFRSRWWLAASAMVITQTGAVVLDAADMVGSDYIHVFLAALVVLLTAVYLRRGTGTVFVGLAFAAMLTPLQRYLGVAATATAATAILLLGPGKPWQRGVRAAMIGVTALPTAVWLGVTSLLYARRGPITFQENFEWFTRSLLEWFGGPLSRKIDLTLETAAFWIICPVIAALVLMLAWRDWRHRDSSSGLHTATWPYILVLWMYGALYILTLFAAASMAYFNKLGGRFLLPLYLPLLALPLLAADRLITSGGSRSRTARGAAVIVSALVLGWIATLTLPPTLRAVVESHAHGVTSPDNIFNNDAWRENPALRYWKAHAPGGEFLLFSNEADGVAFHTRHTVKPGPRRVTGPYGTEVRPVGSFARDLFSPGQESYLIWIEPSSYDYFYSPEQLEEIANIETLFRSEHGSVYRLTPRAES